MAAWPATTSASCRRAGIASRAQRREYLKPAALDDLLTVGLPKSKKLTRVSRSSSASTSAAATPELVTGTVEIACVQIDMSPQPR